MHINELKTLNIENFDFAAIADASRKYCNARAASRLYMQITNDGGFIVLESESFTGREDIICAVQEPFRSGEQAKTFIKNKITETLWAANHPELG